MATKKAWAIWWHGLLAGIISSASTAGLTYLTSLVVGIDLKPRQFFLTIGIGAAGTAFAYLKQSPLPQEDEIPITTIPAALPAVAPSLPASP